MPKNNKQKAEMHVLPKPPLPKAPLASAPIDEAWMAKIVPVLEGQAPPPNEFVRYLAEQVNAANDERTTISANLRQLNNRMAQMKDQIIALDGQIKGRLSDIRAWWDCPSSGPSAEGKALIPKPESEAKDAGATNPEN